MSIITFESWEFGTPGGQFMTENFSGTISFQTVIKRSGDYALRVNPAGAATGWETYGKLGDPAVTSSALTNRTFTTVAPIPSSLWIRTYFQWATKPAANNEEILRIATNAGGGAPSLSLLLRSDAKLELLDSAGASLGVGATILTTGVWYRIELNGNKGVAAAYELRIDGVTELSGTANQTASDPTLVVLGKIVNRNGQSIDVYYDDFLVDNAAFPGPGRIINMKPNANGATQQWTAGTGASDWNEVDEIPMNDDTSYIQNAGIGAAEVSTFKFNNSGVSGKTKAIQPWCSWRKAAGGASATSTIRLVSGATTVDQVVTNIVLAYRANYTIFNSDPNTSLPWKKAALGTLEMGPKMVSSTDATRCTGVGIFVAFNDEEPGDGQPLLSVLGAGS